MKPKIAKLLLVDDNEYNCDFLSRRLERQGYNLTTAWNGEMALALVAREDFDAVLLDIEMPVVSGLEVLRQIRTRFKTNEMPVIMITAQQDSNVVVEAFNFGANDYVTKPIDFAVLNARIRTQVGLKQAEQGRRESEERYMLAVTGSKDGIWDWDLRGNSMFFSERWKTMLGYEPHEIGADPEEWFSRIHPEDRTPLRTAIDAHLDGQEPHFENEHRVLHRDGSYRWMISRAQAIRDPQGKAYRIAGSQTDITSAKVTDPLTGLPNRALFLDRLDHLLHRAQRHQSVNFAVLFLDIDRFKVINDSLGHVAGDQLLIAFAQRLQHCLRSTDSFARFAGPYSIARMGGDEFTIVLDELTEPADAVRVAERLMQGLNQPFNIGGTEIHVGVSIGVALNANSSQDSEDLLGNADTAMYSAKAAGRGRVEVFGPEMRASAIARMQLETEMRRGIERGEFENWYQLIVSLDTREVRGLEALVRWNHPTRGLVHPADFIPFAEESGLIVPIGTAVLHEACREIARLQRTFPTTKPLTMSVNLSCRQFTQAGLIEEVERALTETGLHPSSLKLEITESMVMSQPEPAHEVLRKLKALGLKLEIDDFGTGYSSLGYLKTYPLDTLKIDRSFVSDMETDSEKAEITRTIIALAHNLRLEVIAEGIETEAQLTALKHMGCEHGQGFYFSKPVDALTARGLLAAHCNVSKGSGQSLPQDFSETAAK